MVVLGFVKYLPKASRPITGLLPAGTLPQLSSLILLDLTQFI
jgi:hypothetical protein